MSWDEIEMNDTDWLIRLNTKFWFILEFNYVLIRTASTLSVLYFSFCFSHRTAHFYNIVHFYPNTDIPENKADFKRFASKNSWYGKMASTDDSVWDKDVLLEFEAALEGFNAPARLVPQNSNKPSRKPKPVFQNQNQSKFQKKPKKPKRKSKDKGNKGKLWRKRTKSIM